jgi:hypothetical protein
MWPLVAAHTGMLPLDSLKFQCRKPSSTDESRYRCGVASELPPKTFKQSNLGVKKFIYCQIFSIARITRNYLAQWFCRATALSDTNTRASMFA